MLYAAIDIHKRVCQAAVLDPASGEIAEARFPATRDALHEWAMPLQGTVAAVAVEATCGWRWVWRELSALGSFEVRLAEPAQTRALKGRKRKAEDRPPRCALARALAGEGDAADLVDPARGRAAPARPDPPATGAPPRPQHPLAAAAARDPRP